MPGFESYFVTYYQCYCEQDSSLMIRKSNGTYFLLKGDHFAPSPGTQ